MPTVADPKLANDLDQMAKDLLLIKGKHITAATRLAMNGTITSTRELASKATSSRYKVQESRVKSIVPIKKSKGAFNLKATITVVEVPIPLISLITNTKGKNKGKINLKGVRAEKRLKNGRKRGRAGQFKIATKLAGNKVVRRIMERTYIATNHRGKTHIFTRLSKDRLAGARGDKNKKNRSYVPKIPIHDQLIKDVPNILKVKMSTTYLRILQHEYKRRLDGTIKSSKRN